jgi:hypothetical protein
MKISFPDIAVTGSLLARDSASLMLHHSVTSLETYSGSKMIVHFGCSETYLGMYLNARPYIALKKISYSPSWKPPISHCESLHS